MDFKHMFSSEYQVCIVPEVLVRKCPRLKITINLEFYYKSLRVGIWWSLVAQVQSELCSIYSLVQIRDVFKCCKLKFKYIRSSNVRESIEYT